MRHDVSVEETFRCAVAAMQAGNSNEAELLFKQTLQVQPTHVPALNLLSLLLAHLRRFDEAAHYAHLAVSEDASSATSFANYGLILRALKKPDQALQQFTQALSIDGSVAETWSHRGAVYNDLRSYREAIADFDRALAINPRYPDALVHKGRSLAALTLYQEALAAYDRAIAIAPDLALAWLGQGNVLTELRRYDDAFAAYDRALTIKADLAEAWTGRGNVFAALKQYDKALAAYDRALVIAPHSAEAWLGRGTVYANLRQYDNALALYDRTVSLAPDLVNAWLGRGNVHVRLKQFREAIADYDRALALTPDLDFAARCLRVHATQHLCEWESLQADIARLLPSLHAQNNTSMPGSLLAIPASSADLLRCARRYVQDQPVFAPPPRSEPYAHDRIRVAYLSADFYEHATAYLTAGLFENHDKSRFEITGISFGPDDNSAIRHRLVRAFDRFADVRNQSDEYVADLLRSLEIDIVVDLMGFMQDNRFNVLARRPAPIQVNYLGYPGTMGADCIDYILADSIVIPEDQSEFYSEQVVWLPGTYQINDDKRLISARTPSRSECGLPESGFVFCCFNNPYKIAPETFDIWMRLLRTTPDSVLWLIDGGLAPSANLRHEAAKRGVSGERLVFAPKISVADHLARHRLADLFVDTLPYNAHTTASDALWAGLPVVTCLGATFAGRVAASLLHAIGLDELITNSPSEYEALASKLAHDASSLKSVKQKIEHNRANCALFDTRRATRHIEAAYAMMLKRHRQGRQPQSAAHRAGAKPIRLD